MHTSLVASEADAMLGLSVEKSSYRTGASGLGLRSLAPFGLTSILRLEFSHSGGHAASSSSPSSGHHLTLSSSQSRRDPRVSALLQSYETGTPCILILAENYPLTDFNLNCGFAVLGWYAITACWAEEEEEGMVRWKVRFQWLEKQGPPWWVDNEQQSTRVPWNPRIRKEIIHGTETKSHETAKPPGKRLSSGHVLDARIAKRTKAKCSQAG